MPAVSAPPAATATTAATRTLFTRTCNVDGEGAAVHVLAVHGRDGFLRLFGRAHGHEAKAARAAGHSLHHQVGFDHRAVRREGVLQVVFSGVEGKVSYKQFIAHVMTYCPTNCCFLETVPERRVSN